MSIESPAEFPSVRKALAVLDQLETEVMKAPTLAALESISDTAAAMQRRFRSVKDVSDRAGEVWVSAEIKLADELGRHPKAQGAKGNPGGRGAKIVRSHDGTAHPTLIELGVPKKRAARARRIKSIPTPQRAGIIDELKSEGKGVTPNAVLAGHRRHLKREHKHAVAIAAFSEDGPFGTVVIDPPWPTQKIDRDVRPNQAEFDYPIMTPDEIEAFWKREMASRICEDCHLFMWTTQKYLPAALDLIARIDFRYVLTMVWLKPGGFQPIDLPQYNVEFIIYGRLATRPHTLTPRHAPGLAPIERDTWASADHRACLTARSMAIGPVSWSRRAMQAAVTEVHRGFSRPLPGRTCAPKAVGRPWPRRRHGWKDRR